MADGDNPAGDIGGDLRDKFADLRAGRFQLNGATIWLMLLIALGLFLAYTLLIKKNQSSSSATSGTTQPTSGQQPAAFISEPVSIVNEAPPATVITGTTPTPPAEDGHPIANPLPGHPVTPTTPVSTRPTYQVKSGDTLSTIAAKEHVSVGALESTPGNYSVIRNTEQSHNHSVFTWDLIYPGETLFLPN